MRLITIPFLFSACGMLIGSCSNNSNSLLPKTSNYESEILNIKSQNLDPESLMAQYQDVQEKYNITSDCMAGNNFETSPKNKGKEDSSQKLSKTTARGDIDWGSPYFTTSSYGIKKVYYTAMKLKAGINYQFWTESPTGVDPVMVVYRNKLSYNDVSWKTTPYVSNTAKPKLEIIGWNDDYSGLDPRVSISNPEEGYYTILVYSFSEGSQGTSTLKIAGETTTSSTIAVVGKQIFISNYTSETTNGFRLNSTNGGDPVVYVFDFNTMVGLSNDDDDNPYSTNSFAWHYPVGFYSNYYLRAVISGYNDGGTAALSAYYGTLQM